MKLILASASPRRKEILKNNGYDFIVIPSCHEENISNLKYNDELVKNCACNKAKSILKLVDKDSIIISSDTVVVLNDIILGKPKDKNVAIAMLKNLSDNTHFVATSICLINTATDKILSDVDKTYVTFKKLNEKEILSYIENQKPFDKAGSYGIQDSGFNF